MRYVNALCLKFEKNHLFSPAPIFISAPVADALDLRSGIFKWRVLGVWNCQPLRHGTAFVADYYFVRDRQIQKSGDMETNFDQRTF